MLVQLLLLRYHLLLLYKLNLVDALQELPLPLHIRLIDGKQPLLDSPGWSLERILHQVHVSVGVSPIALEFVASAVLHAYLRKPLYKQGITQCHAFDGIYKDRLGITGRIFCCPVYL